MRALLVLVVLVLPRFAFAGDWCMDNEQQSTMAKALAKVANGSRELEQIDSASDFWCIVHGPMKGEKDPTDIEQAKRMASITDACSKIIPAHDKKKIAEAEKEERF